MRKFFLINAGIFVVMAVASYALVVPGCFTRTVHVPASEVYLMTVPHVWEPCGGLQVMHRCKECGGTWEYLHLPWKVYPSRSWMHFMPAGVFRWCKYRGDVVDTEAELRGKIDD